MKNWFKNLIKKEIELLNKPTVGISGTSIYISHEDAVESARKVVNAEYELYSDRESPEISLLKKLINKHAKKGL
jgi:glutamate synthase domain-containing protein 3